MSQPLSHPVPVGRKLRGRRFEKSSEATRMRGFTLIELLVVIAIISLLVSILVPSLQKAKDLAKMSVCSSNLRNLCLANMTYVNDSNGYLVPFNATITGDLYRFYTNLLVNGGYVPEVKTWLFQDWGSVAENIWRCPCVKDEDIQWGGGYGVSGGYWTVAAHIVGMGYSSSVEQLTRSAELWMFGDTEGNNPYGGSHRTTKIYTDCSLHMGWEDQTTDFKCAAPRHLNSSMVVYIDGHVGSISWEDVKNNEGDLFGHYQK